MNMKRIYIFISIILGIGAFSSCADFFEQESEDVLYAEREHLNNAVDTIYSVTGILQKLQALADRTILLGEVRGDLVSLTNQASSDLRDMANFNMGDDNMYNAPSDYYAVINNCNYFVAHVDTALKSNRNENIFMKEYAAVKAIRAWTYLQLVLNYGNVPFVTEPLLSREAAELAETGAKADLQTVCSYFINDLASIPERYNTEFPGYRKIEGQFASVESKLLFFPLSIVRGDLYLWRATVTGSKEDYRQAALNYYKYINERNGQNSAYPTDLSYIMWSVGSSTWQSITMRNMSSNYSESVGENAELISMIAGDSLRADGHYSELCNLFSSCEANNYKVSIEPSKRLMNISESQAYCHPSRDGFSWIYSPAGLTEHRSGDLRLSQVWSESFHRDNMTGERIETQEIGKWGFSDERTNKRISRNVHIYRRMMVYLRMAEALNMGGFPRMAYQILSQGLSNRSIQNKVIPYYMTEDKSDSLFIAQFDFNDTRYGVADVMDIVGQASANHNMMGIHSRGSGWTPFNEHYKLLNDTAMIPGPDPLQLVQEQQAYVDSLILNESALEFAFEGTRFYDIMRYALRQQNPGQTMAQIIGARLGEADRGSMAAVANKLADQRNWYLRWKGKIGY